MANIFSLTNHQLSSISRKGDTKKEDIDRISMLPDDVLCDILAFMPTKYAVGASILSKRWKYLWTTVPNLNFHDFVHVVNWTNVISFMNFVDRVLSLHTSSLARNFCLRCEQDCAVSCVQVQRWISATLHRDIMNLDLGFPRSNLVDNIDQGLRLTSLLMMPSKFFNRKNLVVLQLTNMALKVPTSVCCFPSLRTIFFYSVQFLDDDSLKNLLSGCPVLERLDMIREAWDNVDTLYISSSTLEVLCLSTRRCANKDYGYRVAIEAPSLRYLHLTDLEDIDYAMNNLSSLEAAWLNILQNDARLPDSDVFTDKLFGLFRKISHIKDLCLGSCTMLSFDGASFENLPMFNHLNHLEVQCDDCTWPILPYLLHCSPNLVTFFFHKTYDHPTGLSELNDCKWFPPHCVPKCLSVCLEETEIRGFEECDAMMGLIEYIWKNAMVLKISISSQTLDLETMSNVLSEFLAFPRSSTTCCQLVLS